MTEQTESLPPAERRWNKLCKEWIGYRRTLPTGERLELCHKLFLAEERETGEEIYVIIDETPNDCEFADLFRRTDSGKFLWQVTIDLLNEGYMEELRRDAEEYRRDFEECLHAQWMIRHKSNERGDGN